MLLFAIIWTVGILGFDCAVFIPAWRQLRATTFPTTTGRITHSELTHHDDSDGTTTGVRIEYDYAVNGVSYQGDRYCYGAGSSTDYDWAVTATRANPIGAQVLVHYRANQPDESLLKPGLDGSNLFLFMFITPFNMAMIGLWPLWLSARGGRTKNRVAGGVKIRSMGNLTKISLPTYPPILAGLGALGLSSFAAIFVVGFGGGFHPSLFVAGITWIIILSLSALFFIRSYVRLQKAWRISSWMIPPGF